MAGYTVVPVPMEIVNDETVALRRWDVEPGQRVSAGDAVAEIETSKTNFVVEATADGFVYYRHAVGDEIPVGAELCRVAEAAEDPYAGEAAAPPVGGAAASVNGASGAGLGGGGRGPVEVGAAGVIETGEVRLSRRAAVLVERHGIDPAVFGGLGLVRAQDVVRLARAADDGTVPRPVARGKIARGGGAGGEPAGVSSAGAGVQLPPPPSEATSERTLSRQKRFANAALAWSRHRAIPSTVSVFCPTRGLRRAVDSGAGPSGAEVSFAGLVLSEVARLLRKWPVFNAYHDEGSARVYERVNIGLAMDAGLGLKVPVIHDADGLSAAELSGRVRGLAERYAEDALPPESLAGGTFTLTDLGGAEVMGFVPIINAYQSAILGIGAEVELVPGGARGFQLVLTFDHQLIDGSLAAEFLRSLRERLAGYESALIRGPGATGIEDRCMVTGRTLTELDPASGFLVRATLADGRSGLISGPCVQGLIPVG